MVDQLCRQLHAVLVQLDVPSVSDHEFLKRLRRPTYVEAFHQQQKFFLSWIVGCSDLLRMRRRCSKRTASVSSVDVRLTAVFSHQTRLMGLACESIHWGWLAQNQCRHLFHTFMELFGIDPTRTRCKWELETRLNSSSFL